MKLSSISDFVLAAEVMLSPSAERVSVCLGDELQLTCSSNSTSLVWIISDPQDIFGLGSSRRTVTVPDTNLAKILLSSLSVDSVAYHFYAWLDPGTSNLVTTLTVANVKASVNETVLNCTELATKRSKMLLIAIPANNQGT